LELGLQWFRFLFDSGKMRDYHGRLSAGEEKLLLQGLSRVGQDGGSIG